MADKNRLNKANKTKFDLVFEKYRKLENAIYQLIEHAYGEHFEETDNRNYELVKLLEKDFRFLIEQLGDEDFKINIKDTVSKVVDDYIQKQKKEVDVTYSKEITETVYRKIQEQIDNKAKKNNVTKTVKIKHEIVPDNLKRILGNKALLNRISKLSDDMLKRNFDNQIKNVRKQLGKVKQQ